MEGRESGGLGILDMFVVMDIVLPFMEKLKVRRS